MNRPLLSVCLITYNQVNYIKQAIEGILMQKTSFEFEIIIADDCSTDGTTDIVNKYARKHPLQIRTIIHEKNVGPADNYLILLQAAAGKYIAYLEGDDYWTDETKLEQQVSFLEANATYALCFHSVYNLLNGKRTKPLILEPPDTSDVNYLLSHLGYINTFTIVFRNNPSIIDMLKKLKDCPFGDFITFIAAAQQGLIKYIPKRMGIYRIHALGLWSTMEFKKVFEKTLTGYKMLFAHLPKEQGDMLKIRYLMALEAYFLRQEVIYSEEDFGALLIHEMNIESYIITYLKQNCEERKNTFHYTSQVPFKILLKSLQQKLLNKIS
jgi:glycosyltransferase involved in cell wall biosynthesis